MTEGSRREGGWSARQALRHPSGQEGAAHGPGGACEGLGGVWRVTCRLPRCPLPAHRDPDGVLQEFIREGCLHKLTRKGLQQRMFFLVGAMGTVQAGGLIVRSQERVAEIRVLILGSGHLSAG